MLTFVCGFSHLTASSVNSPFSGVGDGGVDRGGFEGKFWGQHHHAGLQTGVWGPSDIRLGVLHCVYTEATGQSQGDAGSHS